MWCASNVCKCMNEYRVYQLILCHETHPRIYGLCLPKS